MNELVHLPEPWVSILVPEICPHGPHDMIGASDVGLKKKVKKKNEQGKFISISGFKVTGRFQCQCATPNTLYIGWHISQEHPLHLQFEYIPMHIE